MGVEQNKEHYDNIYSTSVVYKQNPENIIYFELWNRALEHVKIINPLYIVDLGCGPGHMEQIIAKEKNLKLLKCIGYDFSNVAINDCVKKLGNNTKFVFKNADLTKINIIDDLKEFPMSAENTLFISYEFLEHIEMDREILSRLPSGSLISFSVPSYDSAGHVRFFDSIEQVQKRYEDLFTFKDLITVNLNNTANNNKINVYICLARRK